MVHKDGTWLEQAVTYTVIKGLVEIVPIFHTVFARVYHYAIYI